MKKDWAGRLICVWIHCIWESISLLSEFLYSLQLHYHRGSSLESWILVLMDHDYSHIVFQWNRTFRNVGEKTVHKHFQDPDAGYGKNKSSSRMLPDFPLEFCGAFTISQIMWIQLSIVLEITKGRKLSFYASLLGITWPKSYLKMSAPVEINQNCLFDFEWEVLHHT